MTGTLFDTEERMSEQRVDVLASVIAGFIAPGHGNWASLGKRVKGPCRDAARLALAHVQDNIPPEHRVPKKKEAK